MRGTDQGFELSSAELALLLAYTASKSITCANVLFSVSNNGAEAYATDGVCCVHGVGDNDGFKFADDATTEQQWSVTPEILKAIKKELHANDLVRLHFSGASLTEYTRLAWVKDDDGEPYIEERQTSRWYEDAVQHQQELAFNDKTGKRFTNDKGVPIELLGELKRAAILDALPTSGTTIHPGRTAADGLQLTAITTDGTDWTVTLMQDDSVHEEA
jgi:hypothetical protein